MYAVKSLPKLLQQETPNSAEAFGIHLQAAKQEIATTVWETIQPQAVQSQEL